MGISVSEGSLWAPFLLEKGETGYIQGAVRCSLPPVPDLDRMGGSALALFPSDYKKYQSGLSASCRGGAPHRGFPQQVFGGFVSEGS